MFTQILTRNHYTTHKLFSICHRQMDQEKTLATASSDSTTTTISSGCHVSSNVVTDQQHSTPTNESSSKPTKIPSSRFKGVVPQPNGRWGAQIYEKHQRVWLGTFAHEHEAARAYDVAAKRFRGRDAVVNFKAAAADNDDDHEEGFLSRHSKMEIVDMLRKHTYDEELEQSRRRSFKERESFFMGSFESLTDIDKTMKIKEVLFEKVVTPSDVGKLNRLVIPKQHAEKHFPLKNQTNNNSNCNGSYLLNFEDVVGGKAWRFRYSYWNSSQSYVLTRGWSRFVKEKNLKAGDVVSFLRSSGGNKSGGETKLYIDCNNRRSLGNDDNNEVKTVIRIFGVDVCVDGFCGEKRCCSEVEVLALDVSCGKKQRVA